MVIRVYNHLQDILSGKVQSLDVMFKDDKFDYMYENGLGFRAAYAQLANIVQLIAHKEPRLKILELGAGTGGATAAMFKALRRAGLPPRYMKYTFTDVSSAFFAPAQKKFKDEKNLEFRTLDIERIPWNKALQGANMT